MGGNTLSIATVLLGITLLAGCDRAPSPPPPSDSNSPESVDLYPQSLELHAIARLVPDRLTHLAADALGNLYWVQETDGGHDVMFVLGSDGVAHATLLSSDAILAAAGKKRGGENNTGGNIQSIAIGNDAAVLFYFNGGAGRDTLTCVGRYDPRQQSISIVLDAPLLADRTAMGESLALARGKLLMPAYSKPNSAPHLWLWIRHSDDSRLFLVDLRPASGGQPDIIHLFDSVHGQEMTSKFTNPKVDLSAGLEQHLVITDVTNAVLWNAEESGNAEVLTSLIGLTTNLSEPQMRPDGSVLIFAATGDANIGTHADANDLMIDSQNLALNRLTFPVMAVAYDKHITAIVDAPNMHFPAGVDPSKVHIPQLLPTRDRHTWLGYDSGSGQLFKMVLSPRD